MHFLLGLLLFGNSRISFAQPNSSGCQVLLKEISEVYEGECKNGMANGKGVAKGKDSYFGTFKAGLPDGKGTYVYQNGAIFIGNWKKGLKHGEGEYRHQMDGREALIKGYWKADVYQGAKPEAEGYRITNQNNIEYRSFKKTADSLNVVELSFERLYRKYIPRDLRITHSSGYRPPSNLKVVFAGYHLPLICTIRFTIPTSGGTRICNFDFDITQAGKWEVMVSNN